MITPILRTQTELLAATELLLDDAANNRYSEARIYTALNLALSGWEGRVRVPYVYTLANGWTAGAYNLDLPDYIDGPVDPQIMHQPGDWPGYPLGAAVTSEMSTWRDINGYTVERNATGGQTLRLHHPSYASDGRLLWWGHNGPVPTALPTLAVGIGASDATFTMTPAPSPLPGRSGFVKIDSEWMQYAGTWEFPGGLTCLNLVRGVGGTSAAAHDLGDSVVWGVAYDRAGLWRQLIDQTRAHCMEYYMFNTSSQETSQYERMWVSFQRRADEFWRTYTPARPTKIRLGRTL